MIDHVTVHAGKVENVTVTDMRSYGHPGISVFLHGDGGSLLQVSGTPYHIAKLARQMLDVAESLPYPLAQVAE